MVDAPIDVIRRGTVKMDKNFQVEAHTIATKSDPNPDLEFEEAPVYNLVIDHPGGTILWDTGSHPAAGDGHWPEGLFNAYPHEDAAEHRLDDDLAAAGWSIDDIDAVVMTHLHMDHAGGLEFFAGSDTPVFVHEEELKYAYYSIASRKGSPGYIRGDFDHRLNWTVVHRERERHFEDMEFVHLPGHTPGLLGTMIHLDGHGTVIFASDLVDGPENYYDERPLGPGLVWNREQWFDSVRLVKDLERRHDAHVIYGHNAEQLDEIEDGWS